MHLLQLLWWRLRVLLDLSQPLVVVESRCWLRRVRLRGSRSTPLRSRRPGYGSRLVSLWMHVLGQRSTVLVWHAARGTAALEQLETRFNMDVCRIKIRGPLVGI